MPLHPLNSLRAPYCVSGFYAPDRLTCVRVELVCRTSAKRRAKSAARRLSDRSCGHTDHGGSVRFKTLVPE